MNNPKDTHDTLVTSVAEKYEKEGYKVFVGTEIPNLPFELGSYRPDIIAMKSENEGYVIEIKSKATRVSVDQFRSLAESIAQHNGWRFLLVTSDDVAVNETEQRDEKLLLSWDQILERNMEGEKLLSIGANQSAFVLYWAILEATMRKRAEDLSIPIERFPTSSLINHLYSQGELSIDQFEKARRLLNLRNQTVHGFQAQNLENAVVELKKLVTDLLASWQPE